MGKRILVVGASGLIGGAVAEHLEAEHEVIRASRSGQEKVDIADPASVRELFERIGAVDAVISCAGAAPFRHVTELTPEDYRKGLEGKSLGQINLVAEGMDHVRDGGSFTLISGILTQVPIAGSAASAAANGAVEAFATVGSAEMPRGLRLNVVSPTVVQEATHYHPAFPGFQQVPVERVVQGFVRSLEGVQTGQVFQIWS